MSRRTQSPDLDIPRRPQQKLTKRVSPPLSSVSLNRFIYILVILSTLLIAFYSYRLTQWKSDVGGWWNLALGRRQPQFPHGGIETPVVGKEGRRKARDSVEDRINGLAEALGMPSKDLASAIAVAVREYVPPASLSSVAAHESGSAVEALLQTDHQATKTNHPGAPSGTGVMDGVMNGMGTFVGMEEP